MLAEVDEERQHSLCCQALLHCAVLLTTLKHHKEAGLFTAVGES